MNCSTCNRGLYRTKLGWNPELSGLTQAEAIARLDRRAHTLCAVCLPDAPVEWTTPIERTDLCVGAGRAPVEDTTRRIGMGVYGQCQGCEARPLLTWYGVTRKHKPED